MQVKSQTIVIPYYQQLLRLAVNWTQLLDVGYTQCFMRVAASCKQLIHALNGEGFEMIITVPDSVNIAGLGLTTDYMFMKQLTEPTKHVSSLNNTVFIIL